MNIDQWNSRFVNCRDSVRVCGRLINARTGLFFEFDGRLRTRISEAYPLVLDSTHAHQLWAGLLESRWVPPSARPSNQNTPLPTGQKGAAFIQTLWSHALHAHLGKEAVHLALRIWGGQARLLDAYRVKGQSHRICARRGEHPNLLPLLALKCLPLAELEDWSVVKNRLIGEVGGQRVWPWLCKQSPAYVAAMDWNSPLHRSWLRVHACALGVFPVALLDRSTGALRGFNALGHWVRRFSDEHAARIGAWHGQQACSPEDMLNKRIWLSVVRCLRLCADAFLEARDASVRSQCVGDLFPLIADWMLSQVCSGNVDVDRGWRFGSLVKRQARWHSETEFHTFATDTIQPWDSLIDAVTLRGGVLAQALTHPKALVDEARRMHHCVPTYMERCVSGEVRLFHMHTTEGVFERATLEVRSGVHGWQVSQLKGVCNAPVSERMWLAAVELAALYEAKFRLLSR